MDLFFLNQGFQSLIEKGEWSGNFRFFYWGVPLRVGLSVTINLVRIALSIDFHFNP